MSQNRLRVPLSAGARRLAILVTLALAVIAVFGVRPALKDRAERHVVRRTVAEMPNLDVGVRQAVHVTFTGDRVPAVGQSADLKFVVTSGAPGAEIEASIVLPNGASADKGLTTWHGRLEAQEVAEIPVSVRFPGDKGGFVRGEVITRLPDGQLFKNATSVYVDPGVSDTQLPEARTLIEPDGSKLDVVVYRNQ